MRYYVLSLLCFMLALSALGERRSMFLSKKPEVASSDPADADIYIDFETGSAGDKWRSNATPASLATAIKVGGSAAAFTIVSNGAAIASNRLLVVNATAGIVKDGTRGLEYNDNVAPATQPQGGCVLHMVNSFPKTSAQFWIRFGSMWNGSAFQSFDVWDARDSGGGEYLIFNVYDGVSPQPMEFSIHTQGGTTIMTNIGTNVTQYCVDTLWDSNTMGCLMRVRDTNGNIFCQGSNPMTSAQMLKRIRIGMADSHGSSHAGSPSIVFDRIKINTNGTYPLSFP